ncbi:MAG: DUF5711 family protein [Anaerocolumna sp.]
MKNDVNRQKSREYGYKNKYRKKIVYICSILFLIIFIGMLYLKIFNRNYNSYETLTTISNLGNTVSNILNYRNSIIKYNQDGVTAIDENGKLLWNGVYEMNDPIADNCGQYVAVADRGKRVVYIYDEKGETAKVATLHNIIKIEISMQGIVAVLMEEDDGNYINLYYPNGALLTNDEKENVLVEIYTNAQKDGIPIDMAYSDNGIKLITSYLSFNSSQIMNKVSFYNFNEVGQNNIDRFVGGYIYENRIVPKVTFLNNDTACLFADNGFIVFNIHEVSKMLYQKTFESKIQSIFYNKKYIGIVLKEDGKTEKQLLLYNLKGNKIIDCSLEFEYDQIFISGDEIIMYDNLSCLIMKTNGKIKFKYTFANGIEALYPINNRDTYFLITNSEISKIRLLDN